MQDPPSDRPPRGRDSVDDGGRSGADDSESRKPVDFGDIPFGDIGLFQSLIRGVSDAVVTAHSKDISFPRFILKFVRCVLLDGLKMLMTARNLFAWKPSPLGGYTGFGSGG